MPTAFRSQLATDVDQVWLNLDEFGESHEVNGTEIVCVIDTDLGEPRSTGATEIEGVVSDRLRLHAAVDGFPPPLVMGGTIALDIAPTVQPWNVDRISEEIGMYAVDLSRARM